MGKNYAKENIITNTDKRIKDSIRNTAYVFLALLVSLFCYVSYIQSFESDFLANHQLNRRSTKLSDKIQRGRILAKDGSVLAETSAGKEGSRRIYSRGKSFAHVIGYYSKQYGKVGIENTFDEYLSGMDAPLKKIGALAQLWQAGKGYDVHLTIDPVLQEIAVQELGSRRGAVVAIEPKTGEILAMVSTPAFEPGNIERDWSAIMKSDGSPLLNRAVQGLYPPGSTLKPVTAEIALTENITDLNRTFSCTGELRIGDYVLHDADNEVHGKVKLTTALAESCNVTFGTLALELGGARLAGNFERYGFNRVLEELEEKEAHLPNFGDLSKGELAQTGIGQGELLVTPLRMAVTISAFANKGVIMQPYIVSSIAADKNIIKTYQPKVWLKPVKPDIAEKIKKMLVMVVEKGTGRNARISGLQVAGKTGTAENSQIAAHSWFVGFAPADDPQIVVAVIVENAGWGAEVAVPVAKHIIEKAVH